MEVTTTKSWEGHYYNENDIREAALKINLQKKESVWILSNKTLETILKNV